MDASSKTPNVWVISPEAVGWERDPGADTEMYRNWKRQVVTESSAEQFGASGMSLVAGYDRMTSHRSDPSEDLEDVTASIRENDGVIVAEAHLTEVPAGFFAVYRFREAGPTTTLRGFLSVPGHFGIHLVCPEFPYFHPSFSPDRPMTGLRFAHLAQRFHQEGRWRGTLSRDQHAELVRWTEEESWDSEFPIDPMSRIRRYLAEFRAQLASD